MICLRRNQAAVDRNPGAKATQSPVAVCGGTRENEVGKDKNISDFFGSGSRHSLRVRRRKLVERRVCGRKSGHFNSNRNAILTLTATVSGSTNTNVTWACTYATS